MSAPLFTLPSASKEDLQNACAFIQSECSCNRRPYDSLSVVCGGLRPLYSGAPIEAEIIASIISLLSPPAPHDGSWHRRPSSRYVPAAQEVLFKCGGLDVLVACLGYPSALNKPAIAKFVHSSRKKLLSHLIRRCIALAVGLQPGYISRAVHLGVLSSLSDVLSNILKSGIFHNNCARYFSAIFHICSILCFVHVSSDYLQVLLWLLRLLWIQIPRYRTKLTLLAFVFYL